MVRMLRMDQSIVSGDISRDVIEVFPETQSNFRQRKTHDEYYFDLMEVELTIDKIASLNKLGFNVIINYEDIIIH